MPTLKVEQYKKWSSGLPEGWKFNAHHYVTWGEKEICTDSPENGKGVFYRLTLRYRAETEPGGYFQRETGRQIPTVSISRYTPTGSGLFSVVYILTEAAAEAESKRNYNALVKLAATIDSAEYLRRAAEKDTGKAYNDFPDFAGVVEEAAENSDSAEQKAAEETETEEAAENTTEEENATEAHESAENEEQTEDAQTVEETAPEESTAPSEAAEDMTAEAAPDMFATLAAAYLSGKTIKSKPRKIERKEPEKTEEEPEEPEPEPVKEPEPPGYHENSNYRFTDEERRALSEGLTVWKSGDYSQNYCFFSATYSDSVRLVYSSYAWKDSKQRLQPEKNPEYSGFIVGTDFYSNPTAIRAKFNDDINRFVVEHIASEEAAAQNVKENAESAHDYEQRQIKDSLSADYTREAQDLFYKREKPELVLYSGENHDTAVLIDYILEPERMIEQAATEYIKNRAAGIYRAYIRFNRISSALLAIESDKQNAAHTLRKISESVSDEKTVKIELTSGHIVKVEARGVKNITSCGSISDYNVAACDRQYLRKNQYGRSEDIQYTEIKSITHGQRVLYSA